MLTLKEKWEKVKETYGNKNLEINLFFFFKPSIKDEHDKDGNFASKRIRSKLDNIHDKLNTNFVFLGLIFLLNNFL